jgi:hypothetical protein
MYQSQFWPNQFVFSMAPFGYVVMVPIVGEPSITVDYACFRDGCTAKFHYDTSFPVDSAREEIRKHVYANH